MQRPGSKTTRFALFALVALAARADSRPADPRSSEPQPTYASGEYAGSTPCGALPRRFLGIAADAPCERITWRLALHRHRRHQTPATFALLIVHGVPEENTRGLVAGGRRLERKGTWDVVRGTKPDPRAVVYRLDLDSPRRSLSLVKMDENVLHLLDDDGTLLVGDAGASYTLSRVPPGPSTLGQFVGRTPCLEIARELDLEPGADCFKAKWELTLFQDPANGWPTTYRLAGSLYRDEVREGKWSRSRGWNGSGSATVYALEGTFSPAAIRLLKADDGILFFLDRRGDLLVGNSEFSYTLNRVAGP